jgi:hypothetical protein
MKEDCKEVARVWLRLHDQKGITKGITKRKQLTAAEMMRNLAEKYEFGDGGAAPIVHPAPQAPRDGLTPAEATAAPVAGCSTVKIRRARRARRARPKRKFDPICAADPQIGQLGRYPYLPDDLKHNCESTPRSLKRLQRETFGILEATCIDGHDDAVSAAREEGAKRDDVLVQILGAIEALSAQKTRVLDAKNSAAARFSARDAYFARDPAVLTQTLRGFIQAAFDAEDVERVCAAFIDVLHRNGHDDLVRSSALWSRSPRTMLDMPLRSLCGITTMLPHFHFAQKAFEGESSERGESSEGAKPSRLQSLVGPIKARLEAMAVGAV